MHFAALGIALSAAWSPQPSESPALLMLRAHSARLTNPSAKVLSASWKFWDQQTKENVRLVAIPARDPSEATWETTNRLDEGVIFLRLDGGKLMLNHISFRNPSKKPVHWMVSDGKTKRLAETFPSEYVELSEQRPDSFGLAPGLSPLTDLEISSKWQALPGEGAFYGTPCRTAVRAYVKPPEIESEILGSSYSIHFSQAGDLLGSSLTFWTKGRGNTLSGRRFVYQYTRFRLNETPPINAFSVTSPTQIPPFHFKRQKAR